MPKTEKSSRNKTCERDIKIKPMNSQKTKIIKNLIVALGEQVMARGWCVQPAESGFHNKLCQTISLQIIYMYNLRENLKEREMV